ncbi:MAG: TAXI family TRAP transporter solute-binding subunit [Negativicutes bacterium]|nr:TAXI family TRAP transporter solute-binding subunit [Negativicutes bacterium]
MKKLFAILVVAVFVIGLLAGCGGAKTEQKPAEKKFVNIATGGTAGTYYPLGGAIAEILNKNVPGVNASAQSTGASVANINLLKDGKVEMAFVQNDITYYAAKGIEMFKDKAVPGLKGIATLYPETVQIVTVEKTGIKSIADLKGKRVAVGAAGSGTEANARQILEAYGITYNDIKAQYLSFGEAANGLKDGNVDVAFVTAGFPTAAIQDIAAQHKVVLVPVASDKADALIKKYPFYAKVTIPANTYPNQTANIEAVAVKAMLVVTEKMDADLAFNITKAIFTNTDRLKAAHSVGKDIIKEKAKEGMSVDLHAGADKFFKQ